MRVLTIYAMCALMLVGCTASEIQTMGRIAGADDPSLAAAQVLREKGKYYAAHPEQLAADLEQYRKRLAAFESVIRKVWGTKESREPTQKTYVKYSDSYYSRAMVDFEKGLVTVETVAPNARKEKLRQAIITTLLTPDDPRQVDLYSDATPATSGTPFLYKQVLDTEGQPIRWEWRAGTYADYLIAKKLQLVKIGDHQGLRVEFPLVANHHELRAYKYSDLVRKYSSNYGLSEGLVYAIIDTESSFNPFAVSPVPAYGLMQIVPQTAGRDVFEKIKNRKGDPGPDYLFDPGQNIDTGSGYLHLLKDRYLSSITNKDSQLYAVISSYNGGAGNMFKTFAKDRQQALAKINSLSPALVYDSLVKKHPCAESRQYLAKVIRSRKEFLASSK